MPHLGNHLVGFLEALAALRSLAEFRVKRLGIAGQDLRGIAQLGFADGIADADIHRWRVSEFWRPN